MRQYKIYTTGNKLNIIDQKTNDIYSALTTEALVRQLKDSEDGFKIYNVRDWNEDKVLKLVQLLKQDGTPYESVEDFIGNFNGGGTAPKKRAVFYLTGIMLDAKENNTGLEFSLISNDGYITFQISNFDPLNHKVNFTPYSPNADIFYSQEDNFFVCRRQNGDGHSNLFTFFEFGGWLEIEVFN